MNRWCLLIRVHKVFQCFLDNSLVLFASQRKSHARLLLFLLECIVEQLLHKFLWLMPPPPPPLLFVWFDFFWGGSVCLSWLLEPSLPIKGKNPYCVVLFWHDTMNTASPSRDSLGTATPKRDVCCCIYHQAFCRYQLSFFFFSVPLWDLFCCTWLACFTFLWLLFGNKKFSGETTQAPRQ